MDNLLKSRKFWLLVIDVVVSVALHFIGKYAAPSLAEDMTFLIVTIQPIFIAVVAGITIEDSAAKISGNFPYYPPQ